MAAFAVLSAESCQTANQTTVKNNTMQTADALSANPLRHKSTLPFQAPEFDKIKTEHFKPAFDAGLAEAREDLKKIVENPAKPTFENTLVAMEKMGSNLYRAQIIFSNLTSANTSPELQAIEEEYAPVFAAFNDEMYLNDKLYKRLKAIPKSGLDAEDIRLLEHYTENFEIAGAALSPEKKAELKEINKKLAVLSTQYSSTLLNARKNGTVYFRTAAELDGLSEDELAAARALADKDGKQGQYAIALQNTTQQPLLQKLYNRDTRQKIYEASWNRASLGNADDTRAIIEEMVALKMKKAHVLGKKNFAEWKLQDQMAKTPEAALRLLNEIAGHAIKQAKEEEKVINAQIKSEGKDFTVQPWDWNYYAEKVRKAKYDLDDNEIKPYFDVKKVLEDGVFFAAEKFYGITFKPNKSLPVYHPDVVAYDVYDKDGKQLAIYYLDFYTRPSKNGGAWMSNFVEQSKLLGTKPVIVNVFNYQKPAPGKPSLISYDDVETMFHEFGHSIHGMFADQKYRTLSGTNVPRDFVEFPSQINEHFALEPEILKNYAKHYQTGAPIPEALIAKIRKAKNFNQGYATGEVTEAALLDMMWHTVSDKSQLKPVLDFEQTALDKSGFTKTAVPPRYRSPYFAHIFGGGYSAGYYAYLWSETLDADAWEWIKSNGGISRENGDRFRKYILSVGNSKDLNKAYREFTGRDAGTGALLRMRGFQQ